MTKRKRGRPKGRTGKSMSIYLANETIALFRTLNKRKRGAAGKAINSLAKLLRDLQ